MMQVNVTGGSIGKEELDAYIARANSRYAIGTVQALDIHVDGDYVDLRYHLSPRPFSRIRRITGYLVGDMSHWNNAKAAEERDWRGRRRDGVLAFFIDLAQFCLAKMPTAGYNVTIMDERAGMPSCIHPRRQERLGREVSPYVTQGQADRAAV